MIYDVVIVGGGPAGLSAALLLGRSRKHVLLCDAGPRRNAAAAEVHSFLTRDGTPPGEMRAIARSQLARYPSVTVRDVGVEHLEGAPGAFVVQLAGETVRARRVLICTGMVDDVSALPSGAPALWGTSIFQCPFCHAWEARERRFGWLAPAAAMLDFAIFLRSWTRDVTAFTAGRFEVPADLRARLARAGVRIEERTIRSFVERSSELVAVELADGERVPCDVVFARPPQRQTALVTQLGLELDEAGFVRVDAYQQTSRPGIYAAGDLATMMQSALAAAAAGALAGSVLARELTFEQADAGGLA